MVLRKLIGLIAGFIPILISSAVFYSVFNSVSSIPLGQDEIIYAYIISLLLAFIVSPALFIFSFFLPEKYFPLKQDIVLGLGLTFLLWIIFVFAGIPYGENCSLKSEEQYLNDHNFVIEKLKKYKIQNSLYPNSLENLNIKPENQEVFSYKTYNNGNDYIFSIKLSPYSDIFYTHCSSNINEQCNAQSNSVLINTKLKNDWIKTEYIDD